MTFSRYERTPVREFGASFGTSKTHTVIRAAIKDGRLDYKELVLHGHERLDHLAGKYYNDSRFWWIIAAASDIGWALQVPPGTVIKIPDLSRVAELVG
jgi:hypothetical protein